MNYLSHIGKSNRILILLLLLYCFSTSHSQIILSEFLASNTQTNYDPIFTEFADWIELYNAGPNPVNLYGYYLTDELANPTKWKINNDFWIPPGEYRLFWKPRL